jgi:hypothetical protein
MKVAGRGRSHRPNWLVLRPMQMYSRRGWVYREGQGWIFDELTPDELAEFKSYEYGITIPRMKVRLPYDQAFTIPDFGLKPRNLAYWFAYCTMPQAHPLALSRFQIHQMTDDEPMRHTCHSAEPGSYETWLWSDEAKICQDLGCEVTTHHGWGWDKWGVPKEWKPPLEYKEHVFIYAFVNKLTQEVYVGQTENVERRRVEHLRDAKNSDKAALIQSLRVQGIEPKPITLEEVAGEKATERERYWTSYYKSQGYEIINRDYKV